MAINPSVFVRASVYDHAGNLLALDASGDFSEHPIQYENTPAGCGSAQIKLGLTYEDVISRGYWTARNIVELSTGDDVLVTSCSSGATKLYVANNTVYSSAYSPDSQQLFMSNADGSNLCMRIPVTGTGSDGGGPYVTIGTPVSGGGNPATLPAYSAGAIIGRRRYCGQIKLRQLLNKKQPEATITCSGLSERLKEGIGTFTITQSSIDIGTALFASINQFAIRWPELTISAGNFPTVGLNCLGTWTNSNVLTVIGNILAQVTSGDLWVVRVAHDRIVRLVKLYTQSGNTYAYNVTLNQGSQSFEPLNVQNADQDASTMQNSVMVIGDTDPVTKQPITAIEQDGTSITNFGQIDAQPVTNTAFKTVAQAQAMATAILNQNSLSKSNQQFRVYCDEPGTGPNGLANGDQVDGYHNVILTRFNAQGSSKNEIPDSNFQFGPDAAVVLWTQSGGTVTTLLGGGNAGSNALKIVGTGAAGSILAYSDVIDVAPGQTFSFSGYIDATHVSAGNPSIDIYDAGMGGSLKSITQTAGVSGRVTGTYTVPASPSFTQIRVVVKENGCTVASGQNLLFSQLQLERGSAVTAYAVNNAAPNPFGLVNSAVTTLEVGGDRYQDIKSSAIEPDWNAAMAERGNALANALLVNTLTPAAVDQYIVSAAAFPITISTSSLTVTTPSFLAIFAKGSAPVSVGGTSFTLAANTTTYVWLNSDGSWTQETSPAVSHTGSILYAVFQTSASGVLGYIQKAPVGVISVVGGVMSSLPSGFTFTAVVASGAYSGDNSSNSHYRATLTVTQTGGGGTPANFLESIDVFFSPKTLNHWALGQHIKTNAFGAFTLDIALPYGVSCDLAVRVNSLNPSSTSGPQICTTTDSSVPTNASNQQAGGGALLGGDPGDGNPILELGTGPGLGTRTRQIPHSLQSGALRTAVDSSSRFLSVEWNGSGYGTPALQTDGTLAGLWGATTKAKWQPVAGQPITISCDIKEDSSTGEGHLVLGDNTNGYQVRLTSSISLGKYVSGAESGIGGGGGSAPFTNDTNWHSYRLTVTPGSPNIIEGSIDGNYLYATDSSLTLTSGTWGVKLFTGLSGGSDNSRVRNFNVSNTPYHYYNESLPTRNVVVGTADSDGTYLAHGQVRTSHIVTGTTGTQVSHDFFPDNQYSKIKTTHVSSGVAYNYSGVWSSATAYVVGDEVVYQKNYYVAIAASTNSTPPSANWQVVGSYQGLLGAWSSATSYVPGDEVTYNGNYWVCVTANTNSAPTTSNANWQIAGPTNLDQVADGSTYNRTLATALTSGQVDLSKAGVISKVLDNIADTATRSGIITSDTSGAAGARRIKTMSDGPTTRDIGQIGKIVDNSGQGQQTDFVGMVEADPTGSHPGYEVINYTGTYVNYEKTGINTNVAQTPLVMEFSGWADSGSIEIAFLSDNHTSGADITNGFRAYVDSGTLYIFKCVSGVFTLLSSTLHNSLSPASGADHKLIVICYYDSGAYTNIVAQYDKSIPLTAREYTNARSSGYYGIRSAVGNVYVRNTDFRQSWSDATNLNPYTGITKNLCPDSDLRLINGYWGYNLTGLTSAGGGGQYGWYQLGTGSASGVLSAWAKNMYLIAGQNYVLSGYIDATQVTSGSPFWGVYDNNISSGYASAYQTAGQKGRVQASFTVPTTGNYAVICDTHNCTITNAQDLIFSEPQVEIGVIATPYMSSIADSSGYWPHLIHSPGTQTAIQATANTDGSTIITGLVTTRTMPAAAVTYNKVAGTAVSGTQVFPACYSTQQTNSLDSGATWADSGNASIPATTLLTNGENIFYNTGSGAYGYPPAANPRQTSYNCPASGSITCIFKHVAFASGAQGVPRVNFTGTTSGGTSNTEQSTGISGSQNVAWSGTKSGYNYNYGKSSGTTQSFSVTTSQGPSATYPLELSLSSVSCPSDADGSSSLMITLYNPSGVIVSNAITIVSGSGTQPTNGTITGVTGAIDLKYQPTTADASGQYTWKIQAIASNSDVLADVPYSSSYTVSFSGLTYYWVTTGASGNTYVKALDGSTQRLSALDGNILFTQLAPDTIGFQVFNSASSNLSFSVGVDVTGV